MIVLACFCSWALNSLSYYTLNVRLQVGMPESQCIGCKRQSAGRLLEDEDAEDTLGGTVSTSCGLQFASPPVNLHTPVFGEWVARTSPRLPKSCNSKGDQM